MKRIVIDSDSNQIPLADVDPALFDFNHKELVVIIGQRGIGDTARVYILGVFAAPDKKAFTAFYSICGYYRSGNEYQCIGENSHKKCIARALADGHEVMLFENMEELIKTAQQKRWSW
jgi:hypothetical protein